MTPKKQTAIQPSQQAVDAMRLALKALETLDCGDSYKTHNAAASLREALGAGFVSEKQGNLSELNLNCKSVQKRLATSWGYVKAEQAEQRSDSERMEPVAWMSPGKERLEFSRKDTVYGSHTIPLYAAPVRTKDPCNPLQDLTDDELASACGWKLGDPMYEWVVDIGRWAIAADREKNK